MLVSEGSPRTSTPAEVGAWVERGEVTAGLPRRKAPGDPACTSGPDPAGPPPLLLMVHRHGYGLGPGLMGPLVWGTDRRLAWGVEDKDVQLSAPEKTCRLLPELSIKFTEGEWFLCTYVGG